MEGFAERIKMVRFQSGLSQKDFAEKIGITPATLSTYENDKKKPTAPVLYEIANNFGVSIDWLLGVDGNNCSNYNMNYLLALFNNLFAALHVSSIDFDQRSITLHHKLSCEDSQEFNSLTEKMFTLYNLMEENVLEKEMYDTIIASLIKENREPITYLSNEEAAKLDMYKEAAEAEFESIYGSL